MSELDSAGRASHPSPGSPPASGVTFASLGVLGSGAVPRLARRSAELGYRSFWTAEANGTEAFSVLGAAGASASLDLGTGVVPIQLRTPPLTAMAAATLQGLVPDRTISLGIGASSPAVVQQWHGAELGERPIAQVREYCELVRACLSGETVSFTGDFWSVPRFRLGQRLARTPELVIAALGPRMLRLAGEIADGVLLNYLPAGHVGWSVDHVREGERLAGRAPGSCTVYAYVHVGVCDREQAAEKARRDLFSYAVVDAYADSFRTAGFGAEVDELRARHQARDRAGALAAVSDAMVDAIDICGDAATVGNAIGQYRTAGVDHPILMPLPWGDERWAVVDATLEAGRNV